MPNRTPAATPATPHGHANATPFSVDDLPSALRRALDVAVDKQAKAPVILHVTEITGYTDWVLILSGRSDRHVAAVADGIERELRAMGSRPRGIDGFRDHSWDLLDYDEFMIHVFYHPVRTHYDLESMWSDARRVGLEHLPSDVTSTEGLDDALEVHETTPAFHGDLVFGGYDDEFVNDAQGDEGDDDLGDDDDAFDDEAFDDDDDAFDDDELGNDDDENDEPGSDDDDGPGGRRID